MSGYRLIVHRNDVLLGHFDSDGPQARQHLQTIAATLPAAEGFQLQWQHAVGEQRLLSSGPDGINVLGSTLVYREMATP